MPADTMDHVIPRTHLYGTDSYAREYVIPACKECNSLLGNRYFETIGERASYLLAKYESRYAKYLRIPDWSEEEMESVGRSLKSKIRAGMAKKKLAETKIKHLQTIVELDPSIEDVWLSIDFDE